MVSYMSVDRPPDRNHVIPLHDEQASRFKENYERLEVDPYSDMFSYKRLHILEICDALLSGAKRGRLLDLGCGTGYFLRRYSDFGYEAVGCDASSEMLNLASQGLLKSRLVRAYADALPFPDDEFAAVLCIEVTRWLPPPLERRVLADLLRVLEPGGLAIVSYAPSFYNRLYNVYSQLASLVKTRRPSLVRQYHRTRTGTHRLFTDVGFSAVKVEARFFGPFWYLQRFLPGLAAPALRRWESVDRRLARYAFVAGHANVFVVSATKP